MNTNVKQFKMTERYQFFNNSTNFIFKLFLIQTIKRCACSTELCNKNWADAGELPDGPTDAPTQPAVKTVKVGEKIFESHSS